MEDDFFDDVRQHLKRLDKRTGKHSIIPIILNLGISKASAAKYFEGKDSICRATVYNLMNNQVPNIDREVEDILLEILKIATKQALKISLNYRKIHNLYAIESLNSAIRDSRDYLDRLNEQHDINFDNVLTESVEDDFMKGFIECIGGNNEEHKFKE